MLAEATASYRSKHENLYLSNNNGAIDWLIIDRASELWRFHEKEGVGLARKIGADVALAMISQGLVSNPFINNTDADAELPADYFQASIKQENPTPRNLQTGEKVAAIVRPFQHVLRSSEPEPKPEHGPSDHNEAHAEAYTEAHTEAILLYEISLHYYVNRLIHAESPYGYHTVGSTISVSARNYALVRGMPKRLAGEDFYLLNKLAKTGSVITSEGEPIKLDARVSHRTPFGTGSSIERISFLKRPIEDYTYYQPIIFDLLKTFLGHTSDIWREAQISSIFREAPYLEAWGIETGVFTEIEKQKKRIKSEQVFLKFIHDWFDGFRTLKFVHYMRDNHFPSKPINWVCQQNIDLGVQRVNGRSDLQKILQKLIQDNGSTTP